MNNDLNVWVMTHNKKMHHSVEDAWHKALQVGAAINTNIDISEYKDNTNDNISRENSFFCEMTGHYWLWKNFNEDDYIGLEHYRRHFKITKEEVISTLNEYDIIVPKPLITDNSVQDFYKYAHIGEDIDLCEEIVKELYPEYAESWDRHIKYGKVLYTANSYITKKETFDSICSFVFGVLEEFRNRRGLHSIEDIREYVKQSGKEVIPPDQARNGGDWITYQSRFGGFLSERLITLYILHNFKNIKEMELTDIEKDIRKDTIKVLLCCIGRQENAYIRDYVEYYKMLGVANICLFDNNRDGEEDFRDVISDYIDSGFVILKDYRNRTVCQLDAYNECYREYGNQYDWVMFFDIDEYIFINSDPDIKSYLSDRKFDPYNLIQLNWLCVGDCGQTHNDGRHIRIRLNSYLPIDSKVSYDFPENFHTKSIVRGKLNNMIWNVTPHVPYVEGNYCNASSIPINGLNVFVPYDFRCAGLLHYTTKTADEYANKVIKGFPDGNPITKERMVDLFFKRNEVTKEKVEIFKNKLGIDCSYLLPPTFDGVKSNDVKIFSLCYEKKNFDFLDDAVITPLQVGAANGTNVCATKDNTGDNISRGNYYYIENTGTYWIWKNVNAKYKGQMQYRRPLSGVSDEMKFDEVFSKYDVITCEPFHHPSHKTPTKEEPMVIDADTVEQGYAFSHCIDDLIILEMVISMYYPEYLDSYYKYIKHGPNLYYSNGFIMKSEDFDRYSEFLFNCLNGYLRLADIKSEKELMDHVKYNIEVGKYPRFTDTKNVPPQAIKWQCSIGGFLSERLWTLWLQHNFSDEKILKLPYIKMEENMYT